MAANGPVLAKLSRPRLHAPIARTRLFDLLDNLKAHPLIWISGPPGSGKTTLVASWLDARSGPALWFQLDSGDGDAATFFYYLVQLSRQLRKEGDELPFFSTEFRQNVSFFARSFFRALFQKMPANSILVFDNAQDVTGSFLGDILEEAVKQVPLGCNLIVVSRAQPPLTIAKLEANRDLGTLDWTLLRLTREETREIVHQSAVGTPPSVEDLHSRTDGWAAGLVLLLAHLKRGGIERSVASLGSKEAVFAYFAGEIFDRAPPNQQEALMKTAFLSEITPDIACDLTGDTTAGELLNQLYRRQYFTDRRTEPELSYRYHDMFREFLLARADNRFSAEDLRLLRTQAAEVLVSRGRPEEAIPLLFSASAYKFATEVIRACAPTILSQGRWVTFQNWIQTIPEEYLVRDPWIRYWLGTSFVPVDQTKARQILTQTYFNFLELNDRRGQILTVCGISESICLMLDDVSHLDPWIPIIDGLVNTESAHLDEADRFRVLSSLLTALFWRCPGHPSFESTREKLHSFITTSSEAARQFSGGLQILQVSNLLGDWTRARDLLEAVMPAIEAGNCSPTMAAQWCSYAGYYYYVMANDATAWRLLSKAEELSIANQMQYTASMTQFFWVYSAVACRDAETAKAILSRATPNVHHYRAFDRAQYAMAQARLAALIGDESQALEFCELAIAGANDTNCPMMQAFWNAVVGGIQADFGHFENSAFHAKQARRASQGTPIKSYDAFISMLEAYLSLRWQGDEKQTELKLRESLAEAQRQRSYYYFRTFVRCIASSMLDWALCRGIEVAFVRNIINELGLRPAKDASVLWPWPIKVRTIGKFSIEIEGRPLTYGRKVPKKPLALLQCLIALGGIEVPEYRISDALWPDADGDEGHRRLALALHRLRELVGDATCVRLQAGKLSINRERVWVDALLVEHSFSGDLPENERSAVLHHLQNGEFLEDSPEEPWVLKARQRFNRLKQQLYSDQNRITQIGNQKEPFPPLA